MLGSDFTHRVKHLVPPHWEHSQAARTLVQIVQSNKLPRWCKQWEVPLCQTSLFCKYNLTYSVSFQPRGKQCELCSRQPCKLVETTPWWLDENANLAPCLSQYFKSANPSIDGRAPDVRCRSLFISADFTILAHQTIQPMIAFNQSLFSSKGVRICVAFVQTWLQHDM